MNLEETCSADRADLVQPFRFFETKPTPLAAGDKQNSNTTEPESLLTAACAGGRRRLNRQRSNSLGLQRRRRLVSPRVQLGQTFSIQYPIEFPHREIHTPFQNSKVKPSYP